MPSGPAHILRACRRVSPLTGITTANSAAITVTGGNLLASRAEQDLGQWRPRTLLIFLAESPAWRYITSRGWGVNGTNRAIEVLKDSAVIIAVVTGLLYLWGNASYYTQIAASSIPVDFAPAISTEGLLFRGAYEGLFLLAPLVLTWILVDLHFDRSCTNYIATLPQKGFPVVAFSVLMFLLYSMAWLWLVIHLEPQLPFVHRITARILPAKSNMVKAIRFSDKSNSIAKYEGLFYITKKGNKLVFGDMAGTLFIVNEDAIKEPLLPRQGGRQQ